MQLLLIITAIASLLHPFSRPSAATNPSMPSALVLAILHMILWYIPLNRNIPRSSSIYPSLSTMYGVDVREVWLKV